MTYNKSHIQQDDSELPQVFQRLGSASRPTYNGNYKGRNYDPNYNNNSNKRNTGIRIVRSSRFDSNDLFIQTSGPGGGAPAPSLPGYNKISQMDDSVIYYSPSNNSEDSSHGSNSPIVTTPISQQHPPNKSNFNFVRTVEPSKVISRPIISFVKDSPGPNFGGCGGNTSFIQHQNNMIPNHLPSNNNNHHTYHQEQQQEWNNNNNSMDDHYHRTAANLDNRAKSIQITASLFLKKDSDKNGSKSSSGSKSGGGVNHQDINGNLQDVIVITPASRKVILTTPTSSSKRDRHHESSSSSSRSRSPSPIVSKRYRKSSISRSRSRSRSSSPVEYRKRRRSGSSDGHSRSRTRTTSRRRRSISSSRSSLSSISLPPRYRSRRRSRSISPGSTRRKICDHLKSTDEEEEEEDIAPFLKQQDDFYRPDYSQLDVGANNGKTKKEDINERLSSTTVSTTTTNEKDLRSHPPLGSSTATAANGSDVIVLKRNKLAAPSTTATTTTTAADATRKKELQSYPLLGALSNVSAGATAFSTSSVTTTTTITANNQQQPKKKDLRSYPPLEVLDPAAAPRPYNKFNHHPIASPPITTKHGATTTSHNKVWVKGNNTTVTPPLPHSKKFSPASSTSPVAKPAVVSVTATNTTTLNKKQPAPNAAAMNKVANSKFGIISSTPVTAAKPPPASLTSHEVISGSTTLVKNDNKTSPSSVTTANTSSTSKSGSSPVVNNSGTTAAIASSTASVINDNQRNHSNPIVNGNTSVVGNKEKTVKNGISVQQHGSNDNRVVNSNGQVGNEIVNSKNDGVTEASGSTEVVSPPRKKARRVFTDGPSSSVTNEATNATPAIINSTSVTNNANSALPEAISTANTSTVNLSLQQQTAASEKIVTASSSATMTEKKSAAELLLQQQEKKRERLGQLAIDERDHIVMYIMPHTSTTSSPPTNVGMRRLSNNCNKSSNENVVFKAEPMVEIVNSTEDDKPVASNTNFNMNNNNTGSYGDNNHVVLAQQSTKESIPTVQQNNYDLSFEQIVSSAFESVFTMASESEETHSSNNDTIMTDAVTTEINATTTRNNDISNKKDVATNGDNDTIMQEVANDVLIITKIESPSIDDLKKKTINYANTLSSSPVLPTQEVHKKNQQSATSPRKETTPPLIPTPPNEMASAPAPAPIAASGAASAGTTATAGNKKKFGRLPRPWRTIMDDSTEIYYFNPVTLEKRLERPTA